jgi:gamma-glutamylcyclotransferase (GGCT)/AIG2-like uncharacterized protein YtfP
VSDFPRPIEVAGIADGHVGLVVNGGLMRGMRAAHRMQAAGARFIRDVSTAPVYRLWSILDRHPGMIRVALGGATIAAELYAVPRASFPQVVEEEAPGLCVGRVLLDDGTSPLGVIIEPWRVEGMQEITQHGGWRAYVDQKGISQQT